MTPTDLLRISDDLGFPLDAVTETFLIFGKRGSGKSTTATVMTEEFISAGLPVGVIDPMDVWWGLRSSADGRGPGYPVTILGGDHADLPLPPESGAAAADLLVHERVPLVLSLFHLSKTQQRLFVTDFMERLFRTNSEPVHLVIDEADRYAPQRGSPEGARLLGAYEDIVLRGRKPGIGSTSITLRPAQLHSAIRSQVEMLIAMRLLGKVDVQAIDEWIRLHASEDEARELKASLPSLPTGTAWFWSPGWLEIMQKVQVRPARTFDSRATPKVGEKRIMPREFARVNAADLERMAVRLAPDAPADEVPGKVPAEVRRLRAESRDLRAQLAAARAREPERVEVPVLTDGDLEKLTALATTMGTFVGNLQAALHRVARPTPAAAPPRNVPKAPPQPLGEPADDAPPPGPVALKAGARLMLATLARHHPLKMTRTQLATMAGIKASGSTFSGYLSTLRTNGLITEDAAGIRAADVFFLAPASTNA